MNQEEIRQQWERTIKRLARWVNLGWWLERWLPVLMAVCIVGGLTWFALRTLARPEVAWMNATIAGLVVIAMVIAWIAARRRFESTSAARVRLEDAWQLRSRLSAASEGVGEWPSFPEQQPALPLTWQWQRPVSVLGFCIAILCLGAWMPVPARQADKAHVIEKPSALKQVEQWVEELRKEEAVNPQNLAEVEEKMEELLRRPNEQWYEHASLEAADHLRDQTGKDLQELGAQLEQTQGSLSTLAELGSHLSEEAKSALSKQLENQLKGLRSGAMQTSGDLAEQLKNMDPKACNGMSKEQMQKLAERLKQNAEALRKALANAPQFSFKECKSCNKPREGEGDKPGKGAANRGRADADLTVNEKETNLNTQATDKLASMIDPERVTPGDLIGLQDARPTAKENFTGPQSGGSLQSTGDGGAAVEKATLVPAERAVLKRFFK